MKNLFKYTLAALCMLLSCPGCEKILYARVPIYFKLDGVMYRKQESLINNHDIRFDDSSFEYILQSDFISWGKTVSLYLRTGDSSSPELELNKRYPIKESTCLTTYNESTIKRHESVSGWITFTDIVPDEKMPDNILAITGNFEIIFEGYTEGEDIVISNGCINSLSCSRYKFP